MNPKQQVHFHWESAQRNHQAGNLSAAATHYQAVLTQQPDHAEAHHLLGVLLSQQGNGATAVTHLQRAVTLDPQNPIYHNNLGEAYRRQGQLEAAQQSYQQAIALAPNMAQAHYNLAILLKQLGHNEKVIYHYQKALHFDPRHIQAYYNLGNAYMEYGRFRSAIQCYQQLLHLNPRHAQAHNNMGAALKELDQLPAAYECYRQAIQIDSNYADAYRNMGQLLEKQGHIGKAKQRYKIVRTLEPENELLQLHVDMLCPHIPTSNSAITAYRQELSELLQQYEGRRFAPRDLQRADVSPPSVIVYQGRDERPLRQQWAKLFSPSFPKTPALKPRNGKPHIGFLVTHGHEGVFLKCMRGLINNLPHDQFQITLVCSQQAGIPILSSGINNPSAHYLPIPQDLDTAATLIRNAQLDLLHYWEIGTDSTNYFLPFYRLAPVQCTSWGWPVTSGIPQIDYFISSELLERPEADAHYSEKLIRLPHLPTYYHQPPVPPTQRSDRARFGLGKNDHIYLCQQNLRKVQPDFDPLAAEILRADPQGRLLLISDAQPAITAQLQARMQAAMPDVIDRVRIMPRMPEADYLTLTALGDVILDTPHYGGGANTIYDAFAAGTPVVTLPGVYHRSRYATAAYRQMGLDVGIAASPADYVARAVHLGSDPVYRNQASREISLASYQLFEDQHAVDELADFLATAVAHSR